MSDKRPSRQIRAEARAFRIWQVATNMEWQCSIAELARKADMNQMTVLQVLKRKGWRDRIRRDESQNFRKMKRRAAYAGHGIPDPEASNLDLVDLFGTNE